LAAATKNQTQSQSSKPVIEGTAVAQVQVSDKLTTGGDVIASKSKSGKEKESSSTAFSSMYVRTSESAAPSAQGAKVIQSSTSGGVSQQNVADQIAESVYASMRRGDNNIVVRLNPPELGSVVVRFQQQSDQITGLLEVTRDQTRNEIEQALPQIRSNYSRMAGPGSSRHNMMGGTKSDNLFPGWPGGMVMKVRLIHERNVWMAA
jgi:flagellar hook-length control protein FliK